MDAISYEYTKQRKQFGLHPSFADSSLPTETIPPEPATPPPQPYDPADPASQYTPLSPLSPSSQPPPKSHVQWTATLSSTADLSCIPVQSSHSVNTERYSSYTKGTSHTDGAWPSEIKTNEYVDRQRYVRRLLAEPAYAAAVVGLTRVAESVIQQNNTIDCYEQYFDDGAAHDPTAALAGDDDGGALDLHSSPPSAKTVCVFRDPNGIKRSASKISWHPENHNKLAVSYAITAFQSELASAAETCSYIWDITAPNQPDATLLPASPLTTLAYNPRSPDHVVAGSYNGLLSFFDLRKGGASVEVSGVERSHHDPIYDVSWVQSRTGNECCSISTDGQLLWWDIRKLRKGYTDSMWLEGEGGVRYGGMSLEYKSDAGATRFLVGTEQGVAMLCDRKAKKDSESTKSVKSYYGLTGGAHVGPIYSIQRNPFNLKYFLTAGDWSTKVWMEDLKEPIITNPYSRAYITAAAWSTARPAVYYVARSDGCMDVHDLYHRQESPVYTLKVSDAAGGLTAMRMSGGGRLIAVGDGLGSVNVVQVSKGLVEQQKDEKAVIAAMFERETKREKALEVRKQQAKRDATKTTTTATTSSSTAAATASTASTAAAPAEPNTGGRSSRGNAHTAATAADDVREDEEVRDVWRRAEEEFYVAIAERAVAGDEDASGSGAAGKGERDEEKEMDGGLQEEKEQEGQHEEEEKTNEQDD